jgi:WD40 repeat protein
VRNTQHDIAEPARTAGGCVIVVRATSNHSIYNVRVLYIANCHNTNWHRYLATGGTDSTVRVYDLYTGAIATELSGQPDAVGGVSFSPAAPLLALCTGQRHFKQVGDAPSAISRTC